MFSGKTHLLICICAVSLLSCKDEIVPEQFYPRSDHEAYWYSLKQANLFETALGKEWQNAAENIFNVQINVELPYDEAFNIDTRYPEAIGYRFNVKRGQKVFVEVIQISNDSAKVFIDVFRIIDDSLKVYKHIASADSSLQLAFEPRAEAEYILRLQPELLRGGNYTLAINKVPSLQFPITGKNSRAIQSFFGDPRDGGKRDHHGVDIFAKRHTPIIAPCKGYVRFVGQRGLGGNVIWIYDTERHQSLYFAHLQTQLVKSRTYVNPGDTIGTVGNTGNAKYTPPHLHFGIYKNGPIDPYYFIAEVNIKPKPIGSFTNILGKTLIAVENSLVRSGISKKSIPIDTLGFNEIVKIQAVSDNTLRVKTSRGNTGYLKPISVKMTSGKPD